MNKKVTLLCVTMAIMMGTVLLNGCTKDKDPGSDRTELNGPAYMNMEGFPIVKEPITLKAMVSKAAAQGDYSGILMWNEYEKMTGIKIEWEQVPASSITEKRNLALASGEYPDMFFRASIPSKEIVKYGEQGIFIRLNDLIDKYGPNFKDAMAAMPDVRRSVPEYNGAIYALPGMSAIDAVEINPKLFLNKKWMEKLQLKMPATTEDLYTVLKAFKEMDPNGNGKADEIPWSAPGLVYITDSLKGAWGLMNKGKFHPNVDVDSNGKLRYIPTSDRFKALLVFMNKLYREGLIDKEIFTSNASQLIAKGEQGRVGAFAYINNITIGTTYQDDYAGLEAALIGPYGDQLWSNKRGHIGTKGAFTITNRNKYPEAALRWADYFYGDEGIKMFYMGIEGISYRKNSDGKYEYLPEIINNIPKGSSFDQVISKYVPYAGGGNPTITKAAYFKGGEMNPISLRAAENMNKFTPKEIWGHFNYSSEESDRLLALENDINSYVNQMIPQFIQGKIPLNQFNSYVEQIEKMGLGEYMKIYASALERYNKIE